MADDDISISSAGLTLQSAIGRASAIKMKSAYLPRTGETDYGGSSRHPPGDAAPDTGFAGPAARACITKIMTRTPDEVIGQRFQDNPGCPAGTGTHVFYTIVLVMSIRQEDLSTSHFINGNLDIVFPEGTEVLACSPDERGIISAIIEQGRDAISLSPGGGFIPSAATGTDISRHPMETRFWIPAGLEEKITGSYSKKHGYRLGIPAGSLLEYQGMIRNGHAMYWEIYPPMPPNDAGMRGKNMLAVMFFVIRAPVTVTPAIRLGIECRMKGDLWGIIPISGSTVV